jgi:hypothetical protein
VFFHFGVIQLFIRREFSCDCGENATPWGMHHQSLLGLLNIVQLALVLPKKKRASLPADKRHPNPSQIYLQYICDVASRHNTWIAVGLVLC